jgi:hypothetical protein
MLLVFLVIVEVHGEGFPQLVHVSTVALPIKVFLVDVVILLSVVLNDPLQRNRFIWWQPPRCPFLFAFQVTL